MVLRPLAGLGGTAMELFTLLFGDLLALVYHCFDRIVIYGYLSALSRPEQVVHFFRNVVGVATVSKDVLSQRTADYQAWVEAFARNHRLPIEWAEKGVRKEEHVPPWQRRMAKQGAYGVCFIFKSMEQGASFRVTVPKYRPRIQVTGSWPLSAAGRCRCRRSRPETSRRSVHGWVLEHSPELTSVPSSPKCPSELPVEKGDFRRLRNRVASTETLRPR